MGLTISTVSQVAMLRVNQLFQWMVEKKLNFFNSLFGFFENSSSNPLTYMTSVDWVQKFHNSLDCSSSLYDFAYISNFFCRPEIQIGRDTTRSTPRVYQRFSYLGEQTGFILNFMKLETSPGSLPLSPTPNSRTHSKKSYSPSADRLYTIHPIPIPISIHSHTMPISNGPCPSQIEMVYFATPAPSPHTQ